MIYNLNREILHPIEQTEVDEILDYSINVNNREVYKGTVLGNGGTVYIDISSIVRNYYENKYSDIFEVLNTNIEVGRILEVMVEHKEDDGILYPCIHRYDLDNMPYSQNQAILSNPIKPLLSRRQKFFVSYYDYGLTEPMFGINIKINGKTIEKPFVNNKKFIYCYGLDLTEYSFDNNSTLQLSDSTNKNTISYNIYNGCDKYNYVIHYKNLIGGMDSMLMEGKEIIEYSYTDIKATGDDNLSNRAKFKTNFVDRTATKSYKLNTGILSDSQSKLMPNLLLSTNIWIENLTTGDIIAVKLNGGSTPIKTFNNNKYVNYELTFEEDNNYIIK